MGALRGDTDQALTVHVEICPEKKKKKKQSPSKVVNLRRVELYWEMDPRQKKGADPPPPRDDRRDHTYKRFRGSSDQRLPLQISDLLL